MSGPPVTTAIVSANGTRPAIPALLNAVVAASLVPHNSGLAITAVPAVSGLAAARSSRLMLADVPPFTEHATLSTVTADGNDYPELPGSAGALLSSRLAAAGQDGRSDRAFVAETALPVAGVVRGELQLGITVDSKAP